MEKNPYQAPAHQEQRTSDPRLKFDWLYVPLAWAVLLFIIWTQHGMFSSFHMDIALWIKIGSTACTVISIVILLLSIRSWRLFIALPLLGYLVWIQYLVWTFYAHR